MGSRSRQLLTIPLNASGISASIFSLELHVFGGVPTLAVPDNTKTAVTRACRYDPDFNPTYQEFAVHYRMGVGAGQTASGRGPFFAIQLSSSLMIGAEQRNDPSGNHYRAKA